MCLANKTLVITTSWWNLEDKDAEISSEDAVLLDEHAQERVREMLSQGFNSGQLSAGIEDVEYAGSFSATYSPTVYVLISATVNQYTMLNESTDTNAFASEQLRFKAMRELVAEEMSGCFEGEADEFIEWCEQYEDITASGALKNIQLPDMDLEDQCRAVVGRMDQSALTSLYACLSHDRKSLILSEMELNLA